MYFGVYGTKEELYMFSKDTMIMLLNSRRTLLEYRDPVANANIIKKIDRKLRFLNGLI